MKVVGERFDARDRRFPIFPLGGTLGYCAERFETVSVSDPPPDVETLWPWWWEDGVSGLTTLASSEYGEASTVGEETPLKMDI